MRYEKRRWYVLIAVLIVAGSAASVAASFIVGGMVIEEIDKVVGR